MKLPAKDPELRPTPWCAQARKSVVGAEVQRGLMGGGCGDGATYTPSTPVKAEESSVESTGLSFSSFWDWHKVMIHSSKATVSDVAYLAGFAVRGSEPQQPLSLPNVSKRQCRLVSVP